MKHIVKKSILFLLITLLLTTKALAQSPSPTGTNLDELKERLATKVAQLRTEVKRAMHGTVKTVSLTQATIEATTKNIKIELTDDVSVSQIVNAKRVSLTLDDLEPTDVVTVFGTYDETLDLLKAQFIFIEQSPQAEKVHGTVVNVDEEEFTLIVRTEEGRTITIDIETTTKANSWSPQGGIVKSGFSKIAVGDTVHIIGTPVVKEENRLRAVRLLRLGNITGASASPAASLTPTPRSTTRPTQKPTLEP